ncbi:Asp-tRNA(Asn)/Glu-tRNA(Gln) amidotransferase subunit GatC [Candidatus Peregrinibacteria bacterium]|nr:Asp-tRNA(Asn)/Glu-tRNA(Gln) amidotransferase subunit GatC [Candidatus Peregrinibacteria bacterium]
MLTKKDLEHLAVLARIELKGGEEEKLQKDLGSILDHFKELEAIDTSKVIPMTGGTFLKNALREDFVNENFMGKGPDAFPDQKDGYLKVPPVF